MFTASLVTGGVFVTLVVVFGAVIFVNVLCALSDIYNFFFNEGNEL